MTRRMYLLASEQNVASLLELASNVLEHDQCHLFMRYNWNDSDSGFEKEIDFSKSFSCLIDVTSNCGYLNLANIFKDCQFDSNASYETGFITFRKGDEFSFVFAFVLDEGNNRTQNLIRISGKVTKSIVASNSNLLGYLLSLGV